jgi:hypothetical protein
MLLMVGLYMLQVHEGQAAAQQSGQPPVSPRSAEAFNSALAKASQHAALQRLGCLLLHGLPERGCCPKLVRARASA